MTIQGAVYELKSMMLRDDIPDYIKPTIKKVIETVVDEYNEIFKSVLIEVLDKIRAEIKDIAFDWQEIDGEHESFMVVELNDVFQIIDKYREEH